nr:NAD-dependent succinate-semialdehyde dehydrogenase [Saprospiraceae bacterium]
MNLQKNRPFINGKWVNPTKGKKFNVDNPADPGEQTLVMDCGVEECKNAVDAAHNALPAWSSKSATERGEILKKWYELILENQDKLAAIMTEEQGKPLAEAKGEIVYGASFVKWFAEEAVRAYGETIPAPASASRFITIRQPVGVVAAITPWNFPSAMITRKAAPALAAGCTIVIKPSEETPMSALGLAALAEKAGMPPGVFNVITISDPTVFSEVIFSDDRVRKLSFTGSTQVGKRLMEAASQSIKKISLELGGNAPFIVFEDADLKRAVSGLMMAKFRNCGQACTAANRIYIHSDIYDDFMKLFKEKVKNLKVGPGTQSGVNLGPLINQKAVKKVRQLLKDAVDKGARVTLGGKEMEKDSLFFQPTILENCTEEMNVFKEEIFGPVAAIYRFDDYDKIMASANRTPYGLASYFYSADVARCWLAAEALESGMVGINSGFISDASAPFGGIKESGIGREGSRYGLDEYLEIKYMSFGGIK